MTAPGLDQPGTAAVAHEDVVQSAPPGAQVDPPMALEADQMEEGPVGGSSSAAVVPHRVRREPLPAPLSGPDVGSFFARSFREHGAGGS